MKRKTSQERRQRVGQETRNVPQKSLRQERTPRRSSEKVAEKRRRHRKQPGSVSERAFERLQTKEGDPEQALRSNATEESRSIRKQILHDVRTAGRELSRIFSELEVLSHDADLGASRTAFEALTAILDELLRWLSMGALFPDASRGMLLSKLPVDEASERYRRGEHVGAWAGIKLARLYKRFKAELGSRSKSSNRIRDLQRGLQLTNGGFAPNEWFCIEYNNKDDYRPTGEMAVWMARKIEEVRRLKEGRSQGWSVSGAATQLETHTETILPASWRTPDMVKGITALKHLDELPPFGDSGGKSFEAWRKFLRRQLLTQTDVIAEFESLFPQERKKLDGVIVSTLRCAWQAIQAGGQVFFPALSGPCK